MRARVKSCSPLLSLTATTRRDVAYCVDDGLYNFSCMFPQAFDSSINYFNLSSRAGETLAEKPSFRAAFQRRRSIIPMDGGWDSWRCPIGEILRTA